MTRYIPKRFLITVAIYFGIGLLIGLWVTQDIAAEDFAIGALCSTEQSCFTSNAYLIPAVAIVWPIFAVYQPLVLLLVVAALAASIWFMNRKKPVITSQKK